MSSTSTCRILHGTDCATARAIVARTYAAQGYDLSTNTIAQFLDTPHATTWGLFSDDRMYGTISLVRDSAHGLPMDAIYKDELLPLRTRDETLAEVVQFAVDHEMYATLFGTKPSPFHSAQLFSTVLSAALEEHISYLCISINPKHDRFYALLGFEKIGELKHYESVDAPAIARVFYVPDWHTHRLLTPFLNR